MVADTGNGGRLLKLVAESEKCNSTASSTVLSLKWLFQPFVVLTSNEQSPLEDCIVTALTNIQCQVAAWVKVG